MEENKKVGSSIIKSTAIVMTITILTKLLGFVREMKMGRVFATGVDSNLYFWAIGITTAIFMAFATAIASAILPTINEYRISNKNEKLTKYLNKIITLSFTISVIVSVIFIAISPTFVSMVATKYVGKDLIKAIVITQLLVPSLIFITLAYVTKTILQANEKFLMYSIISLPYNLLILIYLFFYANKYGIYGLAIVTTVGWLFQFLIQIPTLRKMKVTYNVDTHFRDNDIKKFLVLLLPLLVSTLIYSINTLVDKTIALNLAGGKVAGLNYGYTVYSSIATTIIISLSTVLYPKFIESNVLKTKEKFKEEIEKVLGIMIYISLPLMVALITLNKPFIEIVYMGNAFDSTSVELTRYSLIFYAIGTVGYTLQEMLMKIFYSLKESKIPMITSVISVIINIILDLVLVMYMDYKGLALATSISITLNAIMLFVMLEKKIGVMRKSGLIITALKSSVALVFSVLITNRIIEAFYVTGAGTIKNLIIVSIAAACAGIVYLVITYLFRSEETLFIFENYLKIGGKKMEKKKGKKILGLFNGLDLIIIAIVIVAIGFAAVKVSSNKKTVTANANADTYLEFFVESANDFVMGHIKEGDIVKDALQNNVLGTVTKVTYGDSIEWSNNDRGEYVSSSKEGYVSIRIEAKVDGVETNNGLTINSYTYYVGKSMEIRAGQAALYVRLSNMRTEEKDDEEVNAEYNNEALVDNVDNTL